MTVVSRVIKVIMACYKIQVGPFLYVVTHIELPRIVFVENEQNMSNPVIITNYYLNKAFGESKPPPSAFKFVVQH